MATIIIFTYLFIYFVLWQLSKFVILEYSRKTSTNNQNNKIKPPPCPPSLPILGHIHHIRPRMYKCFHNLYRKYGPILQVRFGSLSFVLVSSPSLAKEIFRTNDLNFASRPSYASGESDLFSTQAFINAPYGDYWRFMKKLLVTELLGSRQMERLKHVRREEIIQFLRKVNECSRRNETLDMGKELATLMNNITCRMAMSTRCSNEDSEAEMCRVLVKESFELSIKNSMTHFLGPFKKLGQRILRKRTLEVLERYNKLFDKIIDEHEAKAKRVVESGMNYDDDNKDLMDVVLQAYHDKDSEFKITKHQIKAFLTDLFIAGTDTTSNTTLWVMAELLNHPNVLKKVREEINSAIGKRRFVEESDISNLNYLQAVVIETLRLHPGGPMIPRMSRGDCKIGGYDIPKGTPVAINVYSILRAPSLWKNPDEFNPERFVELGRDPDQEFSQVKEIIMRKEFGFLTFGGGRRMCPGMNLGLTLIITTVASMIQCFDWKVKGDHGDNDFDKKVDMEVSAGLVFKMANPILCVATLLCNTFDEGSEQLSGLDK